MVAFVGIIFEKTNIAQCMHIPLKLYNYSTCCLAVAAEPGVAIRFGVSCGIRSFGPSIILIADVIRSLTLLTSSLKFRNVVRKSFAVCLRMEASVSSKLC